MTAIQHVYLLSGFISNVINFIVMNSLVIKFHINITFGHAHDVLELY